VTLTSRAGSVSGYAEFGLAAGGLPRLGMPGFALAGFPGGYLAVGSRHAALAVVGGNSALLDWTGFTLRLGSGLVVASLGLLLFWAALHGGVTAG